MSKASDERYIVIDPTPFTSIERLTDLVYILNNLRQDIFSRTLKVVLPTPLYLELYSVMESKKEPAKLEEIFSVWLPYYDKDHIRVMIKGLVVDEKYISGVKNFFKIFSPISAEEFSKGLEKLGEESLFRNRIVEKFGKIVGDILFEILAISHKLKALIISFGERTVNLFTRLGVIILKTPSKFKKGIKERSNIRRALRMTGYALSIDALNYLIRTLEPPRPFPSIGDIGIGLLVVANG